MLEGIEKGPAVEDVVGVRDIYGKNERCRGS
jgi:hypothetical protein